MQRFFCDLRKYGKYLIYATKAQLKSELSSTRIGWIWWILDPLMFMLIYTFVYSVVFQRTTTYLIAFIFLGINLWKFFNNTVNSSVTLIRHNHGLISKVYVPKYIFVLRNMFSNGVKLAFSFLIVIILMICYRVPISFHLLSIVPIFLVMCTFTFAISCWCLHIGVYFEDLSNFLKVFLQLMFYISGVFYPINGTLNKPLSDLLLMFNPIALFINDMRNALLYATGCNWLSLAIWFAISVIIGALAIRTIYRKENQYIKLV